MPAIKDLINKKTKEKLTTMKNNMSGDVVSGAVINDGTSHAIANSFIGATPNLNSSLGVNAVDGTTTTTTATPTTGSKLNTLYTQNQAVVNSTINGLFGLLGVKSPSTSTAPAGNTPPPPASKPGMAWYWWAIIAVVFLVIVFFIVKAVRK